MHYKQFQTYLMYQFWEHEGHLTPYMTGSSLGKKKVLNVAGGIIYQKNAMWLRPSVTDSVKFQDMLLWSVESYMDAPLNKEKGTALTAYIGYFKYDFGTNYVRIGAQMNPADATSSSAQVSKIASNGGNGFPMMGTGSIVYGQVGLLLPKDLLGDNHGALQPYLTVQHNKFHALNDPVNVFNGGINWLVNGHRAKLSVDYQNRPVFNQDQKVSGRRGAYTIQYQIFI
jgi:hypothetical protein